MFKGQYEDVKRFIAKLLVACLTISLIPFGMVARVNDYE